MTFKQLYNLIVKQQFDFRSRYDLPTITKATLLTYIAYVQDELQEARQELEPRFWKVASIDYDKYVEELADVFIMFVGLCAVSGVTYEKFYAAVRAKLEHNKTREDRR